MDRIQKWILYCISRKMNLYVLLSLFSFFQFVMKIKSNWGIMVKMIFIHLAIAHFSTSGFELGDENIYRWICSRWNDREGRLHDRSLCARERKIYNANIRLCLNEDGWKIHGSSFVTLDRERWIIVPSIRASRFVSGLQRPSRLYRQFEMVNWRKFCLW